MYGSVRRGGEINRVQITSGEKGRGERLTILCYRERTINAVFNVIMMSFQLVKSSVRIIIGNAISWPNSAGTLGARLVLRRL